MTWQEKLTAMSLDRPILLSLATTGLDAKCSQILAVSIAFPSESKEICTMFRLVTAEELMQSAKYHKVSAATMRTQGLPGFEFEDKLKHLLAVGTVWSYNPGFMEDFLSPYLDGRSVRNLPLVLRAMESGIVFDADQLPTLDKVEATFGSFVGKPPRFNEMSRTRYGEPDMEELPVIQNLRYLQRMWGDLQNYPAEA